MEEAAVMMVGLDVERVLQALAILDTQPRGDERGLRQVRRLQRAERVGQGRADHPQLHRLRESRRLAKE